MGSIVDVLNLMPSEIHILQSKYPSCLILNENIHGYVAQKLVIVIPEEDESSYYEFLLKNFIALSSKEFTYKITHDKQFAKIMRARAAELIEETGHNSQL